MRNPYSSNPFRRYRKSFSRGIPGWGKGIDQIGSSLGSSLGDGTGLTLDEINKNISRSQNRLKAAGVKAPDTTPQPGPLERILGVLGAPAVGVQSLIHNAVTPGGKVDPLRQMALSAEGHITKSMSFDHILGDVGWNPAKGDWAGHTGKFIASMAGEVLTDPATWLTLGTEGTVASLAKTAAREAIEKGITKEAAVKLTRLGVEGLDDLFKATGKDVLRFGTDIAGDAAGQKMQDQIWRALVKDSMAEVGQKGGLQFVNRITGKRYSLVSDETLRQIMPKEITQFQDAAVRFLETRILSPFNKGANVMAKEGRVVKEGLNAMLEDLSKKERAGVSRGIAFGKEILNAVPENLRHYVGPMLEQSVDEESLAVLKAFQDARESFRKVGRDVGKATREAAQGLADAADALDVLRKRVDSNLSWRQAADKSLDALTGEQVAARSAAGTTGTYKATPATEELIKTVDEFKKGLDPEFADKTTAWLKIEAENAAKNADETWGYFVNEELNNRRIIHLLEQELAPASRLVKKTGARALNAKQIATGAKRVSSAQLIQAAAKLRKAREAAKRVAKYETAKRSFQNAARTLTERGGPSVDWALLEQNLLGVPGATPETARQAMEAMRDKWAPKMAEIRKSQVEAGIEMGDRGSSYFAHMDGESPQAVRDVLLGEGSDVASAEAAGAGGRLPWSKSSHTKAREYDTIIDRMDAGIDTNTFAPEVGAKSVASAEKAVANHDFMGRLVEAFGEPLSDGKRGVDTVDFGGRSYRIPKAIKAEVESTIKPLFDDEAMSTFFKDWNKVTSEWRKYATVMNPGFWLRNAQSNYYLAWAKGFADGKSHPIWKQTLQMATGLLSDDTPVRGIKGIVHYQGEPLTIGRLKNLLEEHAVTGGGNLAELSEDELMKNALGGWTNGKRITPVQGWANVGQKANAIVEDWGRAAVFIQSLEKHGSAEIAARMADHVLYNYDPKSLTRFEQGARALFPFMTWMRRNLPSQLAVMAKDPSRITLFSKLQRAGSDSIDPELLPEYQRGQMPFALPFEVNGKPVLINPNFGFQDIAKIEPGTFFNDLISMSHPAIKLGVEGALNYDTFRKKALTSYEGQLVKAPDWFNWVGKVAGDKPWFKDVLKKMNANVVEGNIMIDPWWAKVFSTNPFLQNAGKALTPGDKQIPAIGSWLLGVKPYLYEEDKLKKNAAFTQMRGLQDYIRKLRDEGEMGPASDYPDLPDPKDEPGALGVGASIKRKKRKASAAIATQTRKRKKEMPTSLAEALYGK